MKGIKGSSAREINLAMHGSGPVWQHESFDHELRHEEAIRQRGEYICANPVRKGLASTPENYRWIWRVWIEGG